MFQVGGAVEDDELEGAVRVRSKDHNALEKIRNRHKALYLAKIEADKEEKRC